MNTFALSIYLRRRQSNASVTITPYNTLIFLYRSIEHVSTVKKSLLYTKKKENKTILEILDIL